MKQFILFIGLGLLLLSFNANAQSCCKSKTKTASCHKTNSKSTKKSSVNKEAIDDKTITETFTVYGNCGMCEKTIEGSLSDVKGIKSADWNKETDQMTVSFNPEVVTLDVIKQKIADVGYDSDSHRAKNKVYNSLPGCCQYERP